MDNRILRLMSVFIYCMIPFHLLSKSGKRKRLLSNNTSEEYSDRPSKIFSVRENIDYDTDVNPVPTPSSSILSTNNPSYPSVEPNSNILQHFYNSSDISSSDYELYDNESVINREIGKWALQNNITLSALTSLCKVLKHIFPRELQKLPLDARTILRTPSVKLHTISIGSGFYHHVGLKRQLKAIVSTKINISSPLYLLFNIDGLPLFNNSNTGEFWPILMATPCVENLGHKVFPIGFYCGVGKPANLNLYLSEFINELQDVLIHGFEHDNGILNVKVLGFCCDLPARCYIMGTIGHTGFYSCMRCTVKGKTVDRRRVFTDLNCALRTDASFRERIDIHFQPNNRSTPLLNINLQLNFISDFILEPMHLVDLGVMKTLLDVWNSGGIPLQLSANQRLLISDELLNFRNHIPTEFARTPREFKVVGRWKATECRMFLLYLGIIVLKDKLSTMQYKHFLSLHLAVSILSKPSLCAKKASREYARRLLVFFVSNMSVLYGERFVTHNFHSLIHLVDDADHFVNIIPNFSIMDISSYRFENFLYRCKRLVRGNAKPLAQIGRRLAEIFNFSSHQNNLPVRSVGINLMSSHHNGPLIALTCEPQYSGIQTSNFKLTIKSPNNCCLMKNGDIVLMENIAYSLELTEEVIIGKRFIDKDNFYSLGECMSSYIGIYKVKKMSERTMWRLSELKLKYVCLPYIDAYVVIPLLHTETCVSKFA